MIYYMYMNWKEQDSFENPNPVSVWIENQDEYLCFQHLNLESYNSHRCDVNNLTNRLFYRQSDVPFQAAIAIVLPRESCICDFVKAALTDGYHMVSCTFSHFLSICVSSCHEKEPTLPKDALRNEYLKFLNANNFWSTLDGEVRFFV